MKTYYTGLDLLRFLAACWVMTVHYFVIFMGPESWFKPFAFGVPLFFMISGFVISHSLSQKTTKDFVVSRFIRLFPLFWSICTFTYLFTSYSPGVSAVDLKDYLMSMTMLGSTVGKLFGSNALVDGVYWSLTIELIFYSVIALYNHICGWKNIRYFLSLWFIVSVIINLMKVDMNPFIDTHNLTVAPYFLFGITFYLLITDTYSSVKKKYFDIIFLLSVSFYSILISYSSLPIFFKESFKHSILSISLLVLLFTGLPLFVHISPFIKNKTFIKSLAILGGISYPLYLIHDVFGRTIRGYLTWWIQGSTVFQNTFSTMLLMIAISYLFYIYDKKIRSAITKKIPFKIKAKNDVEYI